MSWIKIIGYEDADTSLKRIYDRIKGPSGTIDNVLLIHGLRPHSLTGHMTLYKSVLHNANNTLPKWYLESIGVYVSYLNRCEYCVAHHLEGLKRLLDEEKATRFFDAVKRNALQEYFDGKYFKGMQYAGLLTLNLEKVTKSTVEQLKALGFSDGEILEINQVAGYFNYVNRTVIGLGVTVEGDVLGLSPNNSGDPDHWAHQ